MAQEKKRRDNPPPPPINVDKCTDIANAVMGQEINFTGVVGPCTISPSPNTTWPFNWGDTPPYINLQSPANPQILIRQGLNINPPNNVYQYVVSCCLQDQGTKTVKVTG
jgi:hypothetical protein